MFKRKPHIVLIVIKKFLVEFSFLMVLELFNTLPLWNYHMIYSVVFLIVEFEFQLFSFNESNNSTSLKHTSLFKMVFNFLIHFSHLWADQKIHIVRKDFRGNSRLQMNDSLSLSPIHSSIHPSTHSPIHSMLHIFIEYLLCTKSSARSYVFMEEKASNQQH